MSSGSCRTARVASPTGVRVGCYFRKPGHYVYRIQGLASSIATGVVLIRAARRGERCCGGPCK